MSRLIRLPNSGLTVDADRVVMIMRNDVNQYALVVQGLSQFPIVDGTDKDAFDAAFAQMPEAPSKIAT